MVDFLRQQWSYLFGAVLLHVLFAGVFALTLFSLPIHAPPPQLAIQAVVVDQSTLNRAARREREQQQARQREQELQRAREREAERQRQEEASRREQQQREEQERQVQLQRQEQQQRERQETERRAAEETARKRQAEAERKRAEEIVRKQQEAEQKRRAAVEAQERAAREAELRRQLAEEEGRDQAANSGMLNQYVAMIEQRIVRNWNRPPSARPGLECQVRVAQTPGGAVLSVEVGACNGDAAVRQSIEAAVMRSSPLPPPPDPRLFERNLLLVFKPLE